MRSNQILRDHGHSYTSLTQLQSKWQLHFLLIKTNCAAQQIEFKKKHTNTETELSWVVHFLCTSHIVCCGANDNSVCNEWFCMCARRGQWHAHTNATLSHESWASGTVEMKKCERLSWTESKQRRWMIITQFTMQKLNSPNDCYWAWDL